MALTNFLKETVYVGAFALGFYGFVLGAMKLDAEASSGKKKAGGISARVWTLDLRSIDYTRFDNNRFCTLKFGGVFYPEVEMTDNFCNGGVNKIETDMSRVYKDESNEDLFQKADRKYESLLKEHGLRERVEELSAESEDLGKYFE